MQCRICKRPGIDGTCAVCAKWEAERAEPWYGPAIARYFEGTRFVGDQHLLLGGTNEGKSSYTPHKAFFCPTCGQLWARLVYEFSFSYNRKEMAPWVTVNRNCPKDGDGQLLAEAPSLESCSLGLLKREAEVLLFNRK